MFVSSQPSAAHPIRTQERALYFDDVTAAILASTLFASAILTTPLFTSAILPAALFAAAILTSAILAAALFSAAVLTTTGITALAEPGPLISE